MMSVMLLTTLTVLATVGSIPSTTSNLAIDKIVQVISFHIVAFLVVGLLASRLASRHESGEELKETAKTLASLRFSRENRESIRSGLVTTDLEGTIYTFNVAATEITGLRAEEVTGSSIFSIFGDIREQIALSLEAAGNAEPAPRFEASLQTPDGFAVRIGYSITKLFSQSGEATGTHPLIPGPDRDSLNGGDRPPKGSLSCGRTSGRGLAHEIWNPLGADARCYTSSRLNNDSRLGPCRADGHNLERVGSAKQHHHKLP